MTISEVSEKYGMTQDTLRYYERVGLIPPVPRRSSGIRDYDEHSCGWVEFVRCMRSAGLPVEVLIEYVRLSQKGDETKEARKQLLIEERRRLDERILEMKAIRERLDFKIARYENLNEVTERL
ncbi:MerR family transcriptional regulator [Anaerosinus massiliensis]|uniref:MerR family transcriptional regulator n=1 Tax=Massilibacillus massiliensis TaxID=1806837 RepID=UPI000B117839|nr:MerR family transcriptional regulator [Massilibacillus massiliensis]